MKKQEILKKESEWENMINDLNKKPVEFELKYIVNSNLNNKELQERILKLFIENGYKVINTSEKTK